MRATAQSIGAYNSARGQLGALVDDVRNSAGAVSTASTQVAATSDEAGRAVGEIAMAAGESLTLEQLKLIVLMVMWNQHAPTSRLMAEDLFSAPRARMAS